MRKDTEQKNYCNIRDYVDPAKPNATPIPKFVIGTQRFNLISGSIYGVDVEHKKITPKTGLNAGKEITVHNLLIDMIDENGTFCLQLDLYSQIARSMLNVLAGDFDFNQDMYLGVYKNKADYRTLSIKN